MNRRLNKVRNNAIKLLLCFIFVFLLVVGIFNSISSYEKIANSISINGLISKLPSNMVRVMFDSDGGNLDTIDKVVEVGGKYGELPTPTKDGYIFTNWYLDNEDNKVTSNSTVENNNKVVLTANYIDMSDIALLKEFAFRDISDSRKSEVTDLKYYEGTPSTDVLASAEDISDSKSFNKAYAWIDNTTLYYWSDKPIYSQVDRIGDTSSSKVKYSKLQSIDFSNLSTFLVTNMEGYFSNLSKLVNLNVSGFDTSNVTDMSSMFSGCYNLISLDLSNFNTSKVTNMKSMFRSCSFTTIDLSNFDTSSVGNMSGMFSNCNDLVTLDLSSWNTSNVYDMEYLFMSCGSLQSVDLSSFDTKNAKSLSCFFYYCKSLVSVDLSHFDTSNVQDVRRMFDYCKSLTSVNLSNWNTSSITDFSEMFTSCSSIVSLDLSHFNTSSAVDMNGMFSYCDSLESLNLSGLNTSKVTDMGWMFYSNDKLDSVDISSFTDESISSKVNEYGSLLGFEYITNYTDLIINCEKFTKIKKDFDYRVTCAQ